MLSTLLRIVAMGLILTTNFSTSAYAQSGPLSWTFQNNGNLAATLEARRSNGKIRFVAWCDASNAYALNIKIFGNLSPFKNDRGVRVLTEGQRVSASNKGRIQTQSNERAVYLRTSVRQDIWLAMATGNSVNFFANNKRVAALRNINKTKVKRFLKKCSRPQAFRNFRRDVDTLIAGKQPPKPQKPVASADKDDDISTAEGIALGVLGLGAAIVANELFGNQSNQQPIQQPQPQNPQQPIAKQRVWSVAGSYENIVAADCQGDCEEDIGMLFVCRGNGLPARVEIPWAGLENGQDGAIMPLDINIGNQAFYYDALVSGPGLVGYSPSFFVNPNDPLMEALQSGNAARVTFAGTTFDIGLRGSRSALDIFKAHCGWNDVPRDAQFANGQPVQPQQPQQSDAFWFTSQYNEFNTGRSKSSLTFGIPETDAVGFNASCTTGAGDRDIPVKLQVDYGTRSVGSPVTAYIQAGAQSFQYQGNVFEENSESAGIRMSIDADDPVWAAMQNADDQIIYGIYGGGSNITSSWKAFSAVGDFVRACERQNAVDNPTQQPGYGAANTKIYTCNDNSTMSVSFDVAGNVSIANIVQNTGAEFALIQVPTAIGTRYSNGDATLNVNGTRVRFATQNSTLFCQTY